MGWALVVIEGFVKEVFFVMSFGTLVDMFEWIGKGIVF